jgi:hypothetical protein
MSKRDNVGKNGQYPNDERTGAAKQRPVMDEDG